MAASTHGMEAIPERPRLVPREKNGKIDGMRVVARGRDKAWRGDLYVRLLDAHWSRLAGLIVCIYLGINLCFAGAYLTTDGIDGARPGSFADAFFFSVQTMSTIGYGRMVPQGVIPNLLVTVEALTGFGFFAVVTGLVFAKFSRPTARVLFSNVAVIGPYNGVPHLMLRLANERGNRIVDANIHLVMLRNEVSTEGQRMRKFHDLPLTRSRVPLLRLTWTVMHAIDEQSPLYGCTREALCGDDAEIIVSIVGLDETLAQTIHARHSYVAEEVVLDAAFEDILERKPTHVEIDYSRFHNVKPMADPVRQQQCRSMPAARASGV